MPLTKKQTLALALFDIGAIKFGAFKLKLHEKNPDAPLSPIYLNLRTPDNPKPGTLDEDAVTLIAGELYTLASLHDLAYTLVAGVPNAGDPLALAFCRKAASRGRSVEYIALHKHEGPEGRLITGMKQGRFAAGETVLLIDDLITKADSKLEAIKALESVGLGVKNVVVLVDREQGGEKQLRDAGYALHSVFGLKQLLNFYVLDEKITADKRDEVLAYLRDNS